jgi:hypothetical protein
MQIMFADTDVFNQNLCSWGARVPASIDVGFMFLRAGSCPVTDSPDSSNLSAGPWCHVCSP